MAHIRLDDQEIELSVGELRIGTDDGAEVRIEGGTEQGTLAIIAVDQRGSVTVRRAALGTAVLVNGVALGAEPSPLLHGDRIEVAGRQLRFSDDRKAGSTVVVPAFGSPAAAAPSRDRGRAGVSGGRLVSLVDGREYVVAATGLRIGRDADSDIVVPGTDVSRNHAEITVGPSGYVVRDLSANGVLVNNARAGDAQPLRRGDVIRVGSEEFRFYADQAPAVMPGPEPVSVPLATLEVVNEGASKGKRYEVRTPLAHVGRGQHNDVVILDESVSDTHVKLQRRDSGWFVVDMGSTNGTYVGGHRVSEEQALGSTAAVRFGGVKVIFRAAPDAADAEGGTRVIVGLKPSDQQRAPKARPIVAARSAGVRDSTETKRGAAAFVWIAAAAVIGATILFVIQDR
ncbi:MAG TPA: FHA domain-containing protein [Gemmatimonadaceae bacterium]|nr:FHA domain-containing protein [Gemmatimonadaceae bacterium]